MKLPGALRDLLTGGDRRSIAQSDRAHKLVEKDPALVAELVRLTDDGEWLVVQRAFDLLEKVAREHTDWVAPYKRVFIGPHAASDKWEIRLQIVRALPLFTWTPRERQRVRSILLENVAFPQTFVRAWALNSLAALALGDSELQPIVERHLREFERSDSKALQARTRAIRKATAVTQ